MSIFDLLPDQHTRMFDKATEDGLRKTPPGMAHWAGSGPEGKTCRECLRYSDEGRYAANAKKHPAGGLKPGRCLKFQEMRKAQREKNIKGDKFPHTTPACKYFEQHPNPPVAVEKKYGHHSHW